MNQVYYTTLNSKFVPTLNIIYSPGNDGRNLPVTAGEKEQRNGGKTMSPNAGGAGETPLKSVKDNSIVCCLKQRIFSPMEGRR